MDSDSLVIPELLCGRVGAARRKCRAAVKRAIRLGHLSAALVDEPFVHISDTPGFLLNEEPARGLAAGMMDNVNLHVVTDELSEQTYAPDRAAWREAVFRAVGPAFDDFWFCLSTAAGGAPAPLLPCPEDALKKPTEAPETTRGDDARYVLGRVLRWWPDLCRLQDRFGDGMLSERPWALWVNGLWGLLRAMGHENFIFEMRVMDMEEAGWKMMSFLQRRA